MGVSVEGFEREDGSLLGLSVSAVWNGWEHGTLVVNGGALVLPLGVAMTHTFTVPMVIQRVELRTQLMSVSDYEVLFSGRVPREEALVRPTAWDRILSGDDSDG